MDLLNEYHQSFAFLALRLMLGILFFFQGYDKIFKVKISGVVEGFRYQLEDRNISSVLVWIAAVFTSYVELFGGLLLFFGLYKCFALYALGLDMILAAFAFSIIRPMWDMKFLFPRFVMLVALLLFPPEWDIFSIDHLLNIK